MEFTLLIIHGLLDGFAMDDMIYTYAFITVHIFTIGRFEENNVRCVHENLVIARLFIRTSAPLQRRSG